MAVGFDTLYFSLIVDSGGIALEALKTPSSS
jgi:hypothetical protein